MDTWPVEAGSNRAFRAQINGPDGLPYTLYTGAETITPVVWAGDRQAPLVGVATAVWLSAPAGTVTVSILAAGTADVEPGTYIVDLEIADAIVFRAALELQPAAGTGTHARTAHITVSDLRKFYARVDKLIVGTDDPTALEARADAWEWLCDLLHRHYRPAGWGDDFHFGAALDPWRPGLRSSDLQTWLDAGRLDLTSTLIEAMSCYALARICGGQVEPQDTRGWGAFAQRFAERAEAAVLGTIAEIDSDGDGTNDVCINLGLAETIGE